MARKQSSSTPPENRSADSVKKGLYEKELKLLEKKIKSITKKVEHNDSILQQLKEDLKEAQEQEETLKSLERFFV